VGDLFFTQTGLMHAATWITNRKNGYRMAPAAVTPLAAASAVMDIALKQGAAEDLTGIWKPRHQAVAFADDLLLRH
jgi:hypothetical protein